MAFKTQQEIWAHLVNGGKVRHIQYTSVIGFNDGNVYSYTRRQCETYNFSSPEMWVIHTEPMRLEFDAEISTAISGVGFYYQVHRDMPNVNGKLFHIVMTEIVEGE
jgi:hypothetical protein